MADLLRTHPLEAWSAALGRLPDSVRLTVEPFVAMADVRLGAVDGQTSAHLGVELPTVPNAWVATDTGLAVWLSPDEWLVTSTTETPEELDARLRGALQSNGGSTTDVSAQRISLRLTGPRARDVLVKGCSIDLHPRVFGPGSSAQTRLAQTGVVLLSLSAAGDDYRLLVRSSFAGYLADWLLDAAQEFTVAADR